MQACKPVAERIDLELSTTDTEFVDSFFGSHASPGVTLEIFPGTTVKYLKSEAAIGALPGLPFLVQVGIAIGTGVMTNFIADWVFQRIKRKECIVRLRVNRSVIESTPEGLARKIEEVIEIQEGPK